MKKQRKAKDAQPELEPSNVTVLPPETPAPEVQPPAEIPEVALVIQQNQIAGPRAVELQGAFREFFTEAGTLIEQAGTIKIESADQLADMATARHLRLKLKTVRVAADKRREALKQDSLREGRAIQGFYNVLEHLIAPVEEKLLKMEQFAEEQARLIKENRRMEREAALLAVGFNGASHMNLAEMPDSDFETVLKDATFLHESRQRRAREEQEAMERAARERAEAEAKEKAERAERARVRRAAIQNAGLNIVVSDDFLADLSDEDFGATFERERAREQARQEALAEAERLRQERAEAERVAEEGKARIAELHRKRHTMLSECGIAVHYTMDLGAMDAEQFEVFRVGELERMEAERKAEAERQRLAEEARAAREAAEAAQAAERERIAKAEQERKEREAAERRAARAPDKQKLEAWLESMPSDMPAMKTDAGMLAMESIKQKFMRFLGEAQKVVAELS